MRTDTYTVTLPPELATFVRRKLASGEFSSASEVIRDALREHQEHEAVSRDCSVSLTVKRMSFGKSIKRVIFSPETSRQSKWVLIRSKQRFRPRTVGPKFEQATGSTSTAFERIFRP